MPDTPKQSKQRFLDIFFLIAASCILSGCGNSIIAQSTLATKILVPAITWKAPAAITYGTLLSANQLNAVASVPGTFTYSPAAGTKPGVGSMQLTAIFVPQDTKKYVATKSSVALAVQKASPSIKWDKPAAIKAGTVLSKAQLNAASSVPGAFTYTPGMGTVVKAGVMTLSASFAPADTTNYAASGASVPLTVTAAATDPTLTNIEVGSSVIRTGMKRLGMNIDGQNFYDSGQMLSNLTFRNPGFEGETWQSILHCSSVTATTCTDGNVWAQWPANFLQGGTFEVIYGAANGEHGTILSSTAANPATGAGTTLQFAALGTAPAVGDFFIVRMNVPGNAQAGWWPNTYGGGTLSTEFTDLAPNTLGKQALRMTASGSGQSAGVDSYFDSSNTHNYVLLNGTYTISFRAKGDGGSNQMSVSLGRLIPNGNYFNQNVSLTSTWQNYSLSVTAAETAATATGTLDLHFGANGSNVLLDDVSLTAASSSTRPTVFRDEVVNTLKALRPGSLRYMDGLPGFGSTIDNMLMPAFGRQRAGSSTQSTEQDDIAIGLHEFLQLCQTVGSEPWYNLPPGITPTEMQNLIEYLGGSPTTPYGAKRAALGQLLPWTTVFPSIHLELGNEQWNYGTFPGNAINDPIAYGKRVATIFGAAKSSASYSSKSFDLVMGSFVLNPWYTGQEMSNSSNYDSVSVAPYLFGTLNDTSSNEAIFGPMFAQPEMWDSVSTGWMAQQALAVTGAGKKLVTYEENLSTASGTASQSVLNAVVPSVAGGITMANHMLLQMRDLGIATQNVWALPGISNSFNNTNGTSESSPIFGTVIDMGGQTNLKRPVFLAEQLTNTAILSNMLGTTLTGANPTWNQAVSTNDSVQLNGAHYLQVFAFSDGLLQRSIAVVNLSRTSALPITFTGANAPSGKVAVGVLTSANLTDTNETASNVNIAQSTITSFQGSTPYSLPPFSLTVFTWTSLLP